MPEEGQPPERKLERHVSFTDEDFPQLKGFELEVKDSSLEVLKNPNLDTLHIVKRPWRSRLAQAQKTILTQKNLNPRSLSIFFGVLAQWSMYAILGYAAGQTLQYRDDIENAKVEETSFDCACAVPCGAVNASSDDLPILPGGNGTCANSDLDAGLPQKGLVYAGLIIYVAAKILQGGMSFMDVQERDSSQTLSTAYGVLKGKIEQSAKSDKLIPNSIEQDKRDNVRLIEALAGILLVFAGNYLVAKDEITAGLLIGCFGATILSDGVVGFVTSRRDVANCQREIVEQVLSYAIDKFVTDDEHKQSFEAKLADIVRKNP